MYGFSRDSFEVSSIREKHNIFPLTLPKQKIKEQEPIKILKYTPVHNITLETRTKQNVTCLRN